MNRRRSGRSRSTRARRPAWVILLSLLLALAVWLTRQPRLPPPATLGPGAYAVERVVDGDTLVLANGARVRLIGVDCPETVRPNHPVEPWGPESSEFTRRFVAGGQVRLQPDGPRKDKYDRHLAHVWVDGRMLGEELARAGLATVETQYPFSADAKARLLAAQAEAQLARRGIWSD